MARPGVPPALALSLLGLLCLWVPACRGSCENQLAGESGCSAQDTHEDALLRRQLAVPDVCPLDVAKVVNFKPFFTVCKPTNVTDPPCCGAIIDVACQHQEVLNKYPQSCGAAFFSILRSNGYDSRNLLILCRKYFDPATQTIPCSAAGPSSKTPPAPPSSSPPSPVLAMGVSPSPPPPKTGHRLGDELQRYFLRAASVFILSFLVLF